MSFTTQRLGAAAVLFSAFCTIAMAQKPKTNYDESKVPEYKLPDPLINKQGQPVSKQEWLTSRRQEVLRLFEQSVYGKTPTQKLAVRFQVIESDAKD